jgi:hypothetical protein
MIDNQITIQQLEEAKRQFILAFVQQFNVNPVVASGWLHNFLSKELPVYLQNLSSGQITLR